MESHVDELFVDLQGLEPPDPFVRSIEALQQLQEGQYLHLLHTRLPVMLFPELEPRGFLADSCQDKQQRFHIIIWRQSDTRAANVAQQHLERLRNE